jgi:hypothetical protein
VSQVTAQGPSHAQPLDPYALPRVRLDPARVSLPPGSTSKAAAGFTILGVLGVVVTLIAGIGSKDLTKHAIAAYMVGLMFSLTMCLGALGWTMIMHAVNAGWSVTVRRQWENMASLIPIVGVLFAPVAIVEVLQGGVIYKWMNAGQTAADVVLHEKSAFLNPTFFLARSFVYVAIWTLLARYMVGLSRRQDETGDPNLTRRMRFTSCGGILALGLSVAFASFDWVMSMDYHWFSTMFGVYFFAGSLQSSLSLVIIVLAVLMRSGRLAGLVSEEHLHDLGKLLLAFTVFWAYIAFDQYFLIWYSNIPEETAWFLVRKSHGWENVFYFLCYGHFVIPFLILLFRSVKRVPMLIALVALWQLAMHALDMFFLIRPNVYPDRVGLGGVWIDLAGLIGPLGIMLGLLARRIGSVPLVPTQDPRLAEAMEHRNYV